MKQAPPYGKDPTLVKPHFKYAKAVRYPFVIWTSWFYGADTRHFREWYQNERRRQRIIPK